ncbi:hypothetical protein L228DRAFT_244052 [Xylona heveae TC161]|uniref:Opioid growth factor receptor (OGFr) conserved domain-containing protein n=1 Tax=Xylona heveae (strain CBS 132557 / TC161) TaxID=1328760 RepID=A0A165IR10_XYLHT|nr:hypothetical protein L228DRAFT_244052 [Xylona heveae TC161]KZF25259.1 hypothetical protein L228DRAFT_244052 [Xylona heveae TC161]
MAFLPVNPPLMSSIRNLCHIIYSGPRFRGSKRLRLPVSAACGLGRKHHLSSATMSKTVTASGSASQPPPLVSFFEHPNGSKDFRGRTLSSILKWSDADLEYSHDYIQSVFPLPEISPVNPQAPAVDHPTFEAFHARLELRERLREAFERILLFYGLKLETRQASPPPSFTNENSENINHASSPSQTDRKGHNNCSNPEIFRIVPAPNFSSASRSWVRPFGHNHLRITRIIRSLRILGLEPEAEAFFAALKSVYSSGKGNISSRSFTFWTRSAKRPLNIPPEDNSKNGWGNKGKVFLREFEQRRRQS